MDFYESIAHYYHNIFPLNIDQATFTKSIFEHPDRTALLEVGCGIGSLSFELSKTYLKVVGIDLDNSMLKKAEETKSKVPLREKQPDFYHTNMLSILEKFGTSSFDGILCFGNTLVHLDSKTQVLDFFSQCKAVLKPGGKLLFQILNYDKILEQCITSLPVIENEFIRFDRSYAFPDHSSKIDFITTLTIKDAQQIIHNQIPLLPLRRQIIEELISEAGFDKPFLYGDYHSHTFTKNSELLVVKAETQ